MTRPLALSSDELDFPGIALDECLTFSGPLARSRHTVSSEDLAEVVRRTSYADVFISLDSDTTGSGIPRILTCQLILNARAAALATISVSVPVGMLQSLGALPSSMWPALLGHLVFWIFFFFWQQIQGCCLGPATAFVSMLCIPSSPMERVHTFRRLAAISGRSRRFVVIFSEHYFRRLMPVVEIWTLLTNPEASTRLEFMPEQLGCFLCLFSAGSQLVVVSMYAGASLMEGRAGDPTAIGAEQTVVVACIVAAFLLLLYLFDTGMKMLDSLEQMIPQLHEFQFQDTGSYCCDVDHLHPTSREKIPCDKELLSSMLKTFMGHLPGDEIDEEVHIDRFNRQIVPLCYDLVRYCACHAVSLPVLYLLGASVLPCLARYVFLWLRGPTSDPAFAARLLLRWGSLFLMLLFSLLLLLVLCSMARRRLKDWGEAQVLSLLPSLYLISLAAVWCALRFCFLVDEGVLLPSAGVFGLLAVDIYLAQPRYFDESELDVYYFRV
mmetsp:Transcript_36697/g.84669  ORF Transcript_36697/g.84669 Transcript_36697/m.84669 type:complete len:495 (+) Transcript_36697:44-1528(+)